MKNVSVEYTKVPRWINTEDGNWAWYADEEWRHLAFNALSVDERRKLLHDAEVMRQNSPEQVAID